MKRLSNQHRPNLISEKRIEDDGAHMRGPRILVAGIGNIFMGDDAFGVETIRVLAGKRLPPGVQVIDFGIRGYDLACALMDGPQAAILVDALPRGEAPGTVSLLEIDPADSHGQPAREEHLLFNGHSLQPDKVLELVQNMGGRLPELYLVGCEPASLDSADGQIGLSQTVGAAVPKAVELILDLIEQLGDGSQERD